MRVVLLLLLGLGFGLGVGTARGTDETCAPPTSRRGVFRVAVVDTGFKAAWREELNQQLRERLHHAIEQRAGAGLVVRTEAWDARAAAVQLHAGGCEAVLILGAERPRAFWRSAIPAIAASMSADRNYEPVYLIVARADAEWRRTLGEALAVAVTTPAAARGAANASD